MWCSGSSALGYHFSPRLADVGGTASGARARTRTTAKLNGLARQSVKLDLIAEHWDDLLRLAGSLKLGRVPATGIMRTLQTGDRPTRLAQALAEFGRIEKTLQHVDLYRRRVQAPRHPDPVEPRRRPAQPGPRRVPRQTRRAPPALPRRPGRPARCSGPGGEHHRAVEHPST